MIIAAPAGAFRSEPRRSRGSPLLGEVREGEDNRPLPLISDGVPDPGRHPRAQPDRREDDDEDDRYLSQATTFIEA